MSSILSGPFIGIKDDVAVAHTRYTHMHSRKWGILVFNLRIAESNLSCAAELIAKVVATLNKL